MNELAFKRLRQQVEEAKAEAERAQGARDQLTKRLKEEFNCTDVKAARTLLSTLQVQYREKEKELEKGLTAYEKKWKGEEA